VDVFELQRFAQEFFTRPSSNADPGNLYQGDLLHDFYDDWILPLREQYRTQYLDILLRTVERFRAESEYKLAIEYARKILTIEQTNERAHQHLMFCFITLGERNKALQQYETCQRALWDELAAEPTRETQALYRWIKQTSLEISSLAARVTNLPIPISSFVGRNNELRQIKSLLSSARLVTLTGSGGSGKTRLAIHAATDLVDSFKDGVWWVELAPLTDPSLVPSGVAKSLGIDGRSDRPLTETLTHYLRTRQVLLVLDNCEHLIDACAQLTESLLTSCAGLKILATSREALSLTGERVWLVPALSLPNIQNITLIDLLMQYEGIRLFTERATAINPDFIPTDENAIAIAQICQSLDGIPLAIELAAARVKTMSIREISDGLVDRFQLLTAQNRTSQTRHRTLRAAVDWSYDLLSDNERILFCRLSVFSRGWTLEAAEAVCPGEGIEEKVISGLLARLADRSLIAVSADGQRYGMLETMRQYGDEKLIQAGERDWISKKHLDHFLRFAITGDEKIRGPEQLIWLKRLESEQDNFAGALEMALASSTFLENGCELVCAMCWYWGMVGDFVTMKHWLEIALPKSAALGGISTRAKMLFMAGSFSGWGLKWLEPLEAQALIQEGLEIWNELSNEFTLEKAKSLMTLGYIRKRFFDDDKGFDYFEQAVGIFQEKGDFWWHAWALNLYGLMPEINRSVLEKEAALWRRTGDQWGEAQPLFDLGLLALEQGDFIAAEKYFHESLQIFSRFRSNGYIFQILHKLGDTSRGLKQYQKAEEYYQESIPLA
jgi:predicted ATPase